ncbi:hypothetical protein JYJ95_38085 [Corallococcus exiguus]|uniref:hypothetical protein n=1 Tax=Corallococcus exiguus TaxID=83462 RepID=UPI001A8CCBF7|nr:hypothetical protein [Corallococcus exiguus]MBN8472348.1 hypothetical protein [Corallococcus exiguus]
MSVIDVVERGVPIVQGLTAEQFIMLLSLLFLLLIAWFMWMQKETNSKLLDVITNKRKK